MIRQRLATGTVAVFVALGALAGWRVPLAVASVQRPVKAPRACSLLSNREVSKVLAIKMDAGSSHKLPPQSGVKSDRCDWKSTRKGAGGVSGTPLEFNVATFTGKDAPLYFRGQRDEQAAAGFPFEPVPDLGTDAIYQDSLNTVGVLTSDTRFLVVRLNRTTLDRNTVDLDVQDALVTAAKLAVPRVERG